jgi:hypothetical protein
MLWRSLLIGCAIGAITLVVEVIKTIRHASFEPRATGLTAIVITPLIDAIAIGLGGTVLAYVVLRLVRLIQG